MSLYHKIAEFIMEKIKTEEWKKGQLIPSEKEFCEQFQVSRPTVRAAIAYLANQGYLVTVKGKGTFVSKPKIVEDTTVFLESFSKEMATKGISVQTEVLEQRMIAADEEVASKLKVPCGDEVIKIVRLRYVKDSFHEGPIVYNISYFPKKFSFLLKCNFEEESLTGALTRNHVERHHLEKNIDAVLLEGKIARILGVEENGITKAIKKKGLEILGGERSNAYKDSVLRSKTYQDIYRELKRQFGVNTYKAIKRNQCDTAVELISGYTPPYVLAEQIRGCNAQMNMSVN